MRKRRQPHQEPILVTSARLSHSDELSARQKRYFITMGIRIVCIVLAVVLFHGTLRVVLALLAVVLPWVAVIFANGGPKHDRKRPEVYRPEPMPAIESSGHRVIPGHRVD